VSLLSDQQLPACYHFFMTTVEILYRYASPPTESVAAALGTTKDVYGIRRLRFNLADRTLCVEYDASRLNAATVTQLVRQAGLDIQEELPLVLPAPPPEPVAAA
jgi:hypothetical protein